MSEPSPVSPEQPEDLSWNQPSEVDLVREINGHIGRLATLLGLMFTAASLSLATGPFRQLDRPPSGSIYVAWVLLALHLGAAALSVLRGMNPAVPQLGSRRQDWANLLKTKQRWADAFALTMYGALFALGAAWSAAMGPQPANLDRIVCLFGCGVSLVFLVAWVLLCRDLLYRGRVSLASTDGAV